MRGTPRLPACARSCDPNIPENPSPTARPTTLNSWVIEEEGNIPAGGTEPLWFAAGLNAFLAVRDAGARARLSLE